MQITSTLPWLSPTFLALMFLAMSLGGTIGALKQARDAATDAAKIDKLDRSIAIALIAKMSTIAAMIYMVIPAAGPTALMFFLAALFLLGCGIVGSAIATILSFRPKPSRS